MRKLLKEFVEIPRPCAVDVEMPRPCAVETHARRYKIRRKGSCRCHGLVPWRLTLAAKAQAPITKSIEREPPRRKALASSRVLRLFVAAKREPPRRKAVASTRGFLTYFVAASVSLHGARPWHLLRSFSSERSSQQIAHVIVSLMC